MIVLGTGNAMSLRYRNTSFALAQGNEYLMVDGGGGHETLTAMQALGLAGESMRGAFLSHEHTDHLLGMVWLVRYVAELIHWQRYAGVFTVYSHDVALGKLEAICRMLLKPSQAALLGERIRFVAVEDRQTVDFMGHRFTFFDIGSTKAKQFGFRLDGAGTRGLVFLGDEPFSEQTADLIAPCDWLLSEAFCLYDQRERYHPYEMHHATVREAALCAARFQARNLVLWHTEDDTGSRRAALYTAEAARYYDGRVLVPEDGDAIDLTI